jgi:hypothetical protein
LAAAVRAGEEVLEYSEKYLPATMDTSHVDFEVGRTPTLEGAVKTETGRAHSIDEAFGRSYSQFLLD